MVYERIYYPGHCRFRMKRRRVAHAEVKRIINAPEATWPSQEGRDRVVAQGHLDDGRRTLVVYTEEYNREADVLIVTVIDCESDE